MKKRMWLVSRKDEREEEFVAAFEGMGDAFELVVREPDRWHYDVVEVDTRPRDPENEHVTCMLEYADLPPGAKARVDAVLAARDCTLANLTAKCAACVGLVAVSKELRDLGTALVEYRIGVEEYREAHAALDVERSVLRESVHEFFEKLHPALRDRSVHDFFEKMQPDLIGDFDFLL